MPALPAIRPLSSLQNSHALLVPPRSVSRHITPFPDEQSALSLVLEIISHKHPRTAAPPSNEFRRVSEKAGERGREGIGGIVYMDGDGDWMIWYGCRDAVAIEFGQASLQHSDSTPDCCLYALPTVFEVVIGWVPSTCPVLTSRTSPRHTPSQAGIIGVHIPQQRLSNELATIDNSFVSTHQNCV
ncbi:predicted protein [Plenodomus lingam JN3]|uniref:Predicted protein n=1 Tax=Leptosphaeria maculans (strain JN3 / isolate v23.1.3 / race Av1-4-5-6-7-8) TaxID=985895 RepID=E4ZJX0_LEPMJ|nr:predicted protein [Plenodomus lingam JN3]CBX91405.1 predicted protein [Plenodomus lingam JN3]